MDFGDTVFFGEQCWVAMVGAATQISQTFTTIPRCVCNIVRAAEQRLYIHSGLAEVASQTHALSLLLIRSQEVTPEALDGDHTDPEQPLTLGAECLLLEERQGEAQQGYVALQKLPKSDVCCYLVSLFIEGHLDTLVRISSFGVLRVCPRSI